MTTSSSESMRPYEGTEVGFIVPEAWQNRSIVAFSPKAEGKKSAPSFVVTREPLAEGETLRTFASRQLGQLAKGLRDFALREDKETSVDGEPATQHEFSWRSPSGAIIQRMTMTVHAEQVWLFTATAPVEDAEKLRATFTQMLESVRFGARHGSSAPPAGSSSPPAGPELPPDWWPGNRRRG
jgi:hypothetical protein